MFNGGKAGTKPWMKALAITNKDLYAAKFLTLHLLRLRLHGLYIKTHIELALEDSTMIYLTQHKEYSARFGLKKALYDTEIAQQIAEEKYRSLVGREIFSKEISDIHKLIEELRAWVISMEPTPQAACKH